MSDKVFLNDEIVEASAAKISASDAGFLYGAGLFETMLCMGGKVFCIDEHLERLMTSAKRLGVAVTYDKEYLAKAVYQAIEANELVDARIRLTVSGGPMNVSDEDARSTVLVAATQLSGYPKEFYEKGILVVLSSFRQNPSDGVSGHKCTSYFSRMLALREAQSKGATECIWFTTNNLLAEGSITNVYVVKDSKIYTPKLETPVLGGIARKAVKRLAGENGIEFIEQDMGVGNLMQADEVFLTNVVMKVMPVANIEKHVVGGGKGWPVTNKIGELYDDYISEQCGVGK